MARFTRYRKRRRRRADPVSWLEKKALVRIAKDVPCLDCGHRFPAVCMDFDHVRGKKRFNISQMVGGGVTPQALAEEIAKCEVVCSNCHRIREDRRIRLVRVA